MEKQRVIKTLLQQRLNNGELRAQPPKKDWKREKTAGKKHFFGASKETHRGPQPIRGKPEELLILDTHIHRRLILTKVCWTSE